MSNTVEVQVVQADGSASKGTVRDHTVIMDRPEAKGGGNKGAMGGEILLVALGGCFMSNLLAAIEAREAAVSNVRLAIAGTLESAPPHFSAIQVEVFADYKDREAMEKLVTIAERGCINANTLKNAVNLSIRIA
jgi:putative redox protein